MIVTVEAFHKANPLVAGIHKDELRTLLEVNGEVFSAVLAASISAKKLEAAGEQVRFAGRGVVMDDAETKARKAIEAAFQSAGVKVPSLNEVMAKLPVDKTRAQKIVTLLLRDRVLIKLTDELVFHQASLTSLKELVKQQKAKTPAMDVATFKDLIGVTRKYAIPLLEYLDRERVTRREGDKRVIL